MATESSRNGPSTVRRALITAGTAVLGAGAIGLGVLASREGGAIAPGKSRANPVTGDDALPSAVDVVVIGGGNIGCFAALTLAERGIKVALCEKGSIAGEASGRSAGWIDSLLSDPAKIEINNRSKELWEGLNDRVGAETGFRRTGTAALFSDSDGVDFAKGWLDSLSGAVSGRILNAAEASALTNGSPDKFAGAIHIPSDGCAEPQLVAPAVATRVRQLGGTILQSCTVRGFETSAGRISAVVTEKGTIKCSSAVVCGGIWSPLLLQSIGIDLPQFTAFGSAMRFGPSGAGPGTALVFVKRNVVIRRGFDGHYDACIPIAIAAITPSAVVNLFRLRTTIRAMWDQLRPVFNLHTFTTFLRMATHWHLDQASPFENHRVFVPEVHFGMLHETAQGVREALPQVGAGKVLERWAGAMMTTLDNMPVISDVAGHPGLYIGSGFYFGLTMAPAAGEALADLVMRQQPKIKLEAYRLSRFSDGSPIVFHE
jgi:glycine/D-amino acid oxidase-like deaminating enzyme